jgi:hypothetical protein
MTNNDHGGRKEATGVWAWKMDTLQPGENITLTYSLDGLEKGDWTETDVFYRGSQEIIGAMKMDEKYLEEIRNQEKILRDLNSAPQEVIETPEADEKTDDANIPIPEPAVRPPTGQSTLFGGEQ